MNKERIDENRKYVNAREGLVFDYIEDLGLWIIGGFGPVDIQPNEIKFEYLSPSDFPNGEGTLLMVVEILEEWISILSNVLIMEQPILLVRIRLFCIHSF